MAPSHLNSARKRAKMNYRKLAFMRLRDLCATINCIEFVNLESLSSEDRSKVA